MNDTILSKFIIYFQNLQNITFISFFIGIIRLSIIVNRRPDRKLLIEWEMYLC